MIFDEKGHNQLYDNLKVNNDLKKEMLKACEKAQNNSSLRKDEISIRRNAKMKKKKLYGTMVKNVSVAVVSVALSGAIIVGALNQVKKNNVKSSSLAGGMESIEVTTDTVTKVTEATTEEITEQSTAYEESKQESTHDESTSGEDKAIKKAVEEFSANEKLWKPVFNDISETPSYTMTDLDHNGNPEVIVATMAGSAKNTYMHIYELVDGKIVDRNEDGGMGPEAAFSLPDITTVDELSTYFDGGRYVYIAPDYLPIREAESSTDYEYKNAFLLENGFFGNNTIATKKTVNGKITFTDHNGKEITEKEFNDADKTMYSEENGYKSSITKIKWTDLSNGNMELYDCYKVFAGEEN